MAGNLVINGKDGPTSVQATHAVGESCIAAHCDRPPGRGRPEAS